MKKLDYKKLMIWGIPTIIILSVLITLVVFFMNTNKSIETSSNTVKTITENDQTNIIVPNVTKNNTTFKISDTKKKVESVNISATNRLSGYNLCYILVFNDTNTDEIKNEDYLIFNDLLLILDENCTIYFKYELDGNYSNESYKVKISNIKVPEKESEKATHKAKARSIFIVFILFNPFKIKAVYHF